MASLGYPMQRISVLCGNCNTVVGAPPGHPYVRCGACGTVLRVSGSVPMHTAPASVQTEFLNGLIGRLNERRGSNQRERAITGASQRAIDALERFEADRAFCEKNVECVICAEDFTPSIRLCRLPCQHAFHEECILKWLKQKNTCPVCRHELEAGSPITTGAYQPATNLNQQRAQINANVYFLEDTHGQPVFRGEAAPYGAGNNAYARQYVPPIRRSSQTGACTIC